jgi:succinate dehydrogenase hydrophobic anchor subunit
MLRKSRLVLPGDPEYMGHRDAEKRRQETREWLLQRERAIAKRRRETHEWLLQRERAIAKRRRETREWLLQRAAPPTSKMNSRLGTQVS